MEIAYAQQFMKLFSLSHIGNGNISIFILRL